MFDEEAKSKPSLKDKIKDKVSAKLNAIKSGLVLKKNRQKSDEIEINSTSDDDKTNFYSATSQIKKPNATQDYKQDFNEALDHTRTVAALNSKSLGERISSQFGNLVGSRFKGPIRDKFNVNPAALALKAESFDPSRFASPRFLKFIALLIAIIWVTYHLAGLISLFAEKYIPETSSSRSLRFSDGMQNRKTDHDYEAIIARNLFSSRGLIPGELAGGNNVPVRTNLPLQLVGTVILKNELRSIASIEDKNEKQVYPVRAEDEIPGKIRIVSIEAYKVIFVNLNNGMKEFIDMPESYQGSALTLGGSNKAFKSGAKGGNGSSIEQTAENQFNIPRAEVDKAMADMNSILTQARAIPYTENGQAAGYKLIQIVPGSIYEKLGLQNNDVITGLNGEPINDPGKAFEMMSQLKTASRMQLGVKREGKTSTFTYDFR